MDLDLLDHIKRITISAIVSDDVLMEMLVLKGGIALDLIYDILPRSSMDVDFSIDGDFSDDAESMRDRFETLLKSAFDEYGYKVFDVRFEERPQTLSPELAGFWGGYHLEFKLISSSHHSVGEGIDAMRRNSLALSPSHEKRIRVDFSKYEACDEREPHVVNGLQVFVYTPTLLATEKLRAICQQMPSYRISVKSPSASPRPRDFVDIHTLDVRLGARPAFPDHADLIKRVFQAKRVPLSLLGEIRDVRAFHIEGFRSVEDTVKPGHQLKPFDFYFDHVCSIADGLKPLWDE